MSEHIENGDQFLADGKVNGAIAAYSKALESDPLAPDALYGMAEAKSQTEDRDEAIAYYRKAIEVEPRAKGMIALSRILMEQEQLTESAALLESALELDPENGDAYLLQAELASRKGGFEEAEQLLKRAVRRGASPSPAHVFNLYRQWSEALCAANENAEAARIVGEAARYYHDVVHLMLLAGGLSERMGRRAEAVQRYKAAIRVLPEGKLRISTLEKIAHLAT